MLVTQIIFGLCVFVAIAAVAYVVLMPKIGPATIAERRLADLTSQGDVGNARAVIDRQKRRAVQQNLEDIQAEEKLRRKIPIDVLIRQAGLDWSLQRYYVMMAAGAMVTSITVYMVSMDLLMTVAASLVAPLIWPKLYISRARSKRISKFLDQFPTGIDIIVRGLKSGLPIRVCLETISTETDEPMKGEFQDVIAAQVLGLSIADSVARLRLTVPSPETNFFITLIEVQQQAGGNLADTLSTLSSMIRARKQLRDKVKVLAAQPKMSAYIIAAVPILVMTAISFISPGYLDPLFGTLLGKVILFGCVVWAGLGALMMKMMMNVKI